jgi:hypothetical protein
VSDSEWVSAGDITPRKSMQQPETSFRVERRNGFSRDPRLLVATLENLCLVSCVG